MKNNYLITMVRIISLLELLNVQFKFNLHISRDGQNHHMLMILKSKSNHLNTGDLKSKSKSF